MKSSMRFEGKLSLLMIVVGVAACFLAVPTPATAQSQGNNAVCTSPSACSGTTGTAAFIDASVLASGTICSTLYGILSSISYTYPSGGAVIDARGLNSGNTSMTCAAGTTPWTNGSTPVHVPSTILLPTGTIIIPTTWLVPSLTRLIGQGDTINVKD